MSSTPNHDSKSERFRMPSKITKSPLKVITSVNVADKETENFLTTEKKEESNTAVKDNQEDTNSWHCLTCGVDMGIHNPRQLCGKWKCLSEDDDA